MIDIILFPIIPLKYPRILPFFFHICTCFLGLPTKTVYPLAIKHGNGKSSINGGFKGKHHLYQWWISGFSIAT
jgi:hypothetical protein